eukprot:scaffold16412_cov59-Phaeocystis_antarctica.AAC.12
MRLSAKLCAAGGMGGIGACWYEYSVFTNCELSACPKPVGGMLSAGAAESSMRPAASLPGAASVIPGGS